jgi:hypothetical protein
MCRMCHQHSLEASIQQLASGTCASGAQDCRGAPHAVLAWTLVGGEWPSQQAGSTCTPTLPSGVRVTSAPCPCSYYNLYRQVTFSRPRYNKRVNSPVNKCDEETCLCAWCAALSSSPAWGRERGSEPACALCSQVLSVAMAPSALPHKKIVKKRTLKFPRHQSDEFVTVKSSWRRPRGIDSRQRRKYAAPSAMAHARASPRHPLPPKRS